MAAQRARGGRGGDPFRRAAGREHPLERAGRGRRGADPARVACPHPEGSQDHAGRRGGAGRHAGVVRSARGPVRGVPHRGGVTDTPPTARVPVPDLGTFLLLVAGGLGAGLSGTMAGLASLFSYPALLAAGLPAVAANVTNTVALTATSVGAAAGSRPELTGQWPPSGASPRSSRSAVRWGRRCCSSRRRGVREDGAGAGGRGRGGAAVPAADPRGRAAPGAPRGRRPPRGSARPRRDPRGRRVRRLLRRRGRGDAAGAAARRVAGLAAAGQRDQERAARAVERGRRRRVRLRAGRLVGGAAAGPRRARGLAARARGGPPPARDGAAGGDRTGGPRVGGRARRRRW